MTVHQVGDFNGGDAPSSCDVTVLVIAGGRGRRLGGVEPGHKAAVPVGDQSMLGHTLASIPAGVDVVVVGPRQADIGRGVTWTQERPPGTGPLAAIAAGLEGASSSLVAIVAGDVPRGGEVIAPLRASLGPSADAAVIVQSDGRPNPLLALWHRERLRRALDRCGPLAGLPVARLYDDVVVVEVIDDVGVATDLDTPRDVVDFVAAHGARRDGADSGSPDRPRRPSP